MSSVGALRAPLSSGHEVINYYLYTSFLVQRLDIQPLSREIGLRIARYSTRMMINWVNGKVAVAGINSNPIGQDIVAYQVIQQQNEKQ